MIEERRLKINQELADKATPKLVTLNCSLSLKNGEQHEMAVTLDYTNLTANGNKAEFYENEIRWSYSLSNGNTYHETLNRLSGFYNVFTDQFVLGTGRCVPATKQF